MVETAKVGGGIGFGIGTSALIISLAISGARLVVIGIVAIAAPIIGKVFGEKLGWGAGKIYDIVEEIRVGNNGCYFYNF